MRKLLLTELIQTFVGLLFLVYLGLLTAGALVTYYGAVLPYEILVATDLFVAFMVILSIIATISSVIMVYWEPEKIGEMGPVTVVHIFLAAVNVVLLLLNAYTVPCAIAIISYLVSYWVRLVWYPFATRDSNADN